MLLQYALLITAPASDAHAAVLGFCHTISSPGSAMDCRCIERRFGIQWRFHDEMQPSIRADQQREVVWLRAVVRQGNVEKSLRILEESVHSGTYRLTGEELEGIAHAKSVFVQ